MDGSNGIRARVGSTAKLEARVVVRIRAREATQLVGQQSQCVTLRPEKRKARHVSVGRTARVLAGDNKYGFDDGKRFGYAS